MAHGGTPCTAIPHARQSVLATVLALVGTLLGGPAPHATAQDATPAVASPAAASGDFAGLVDIGGGRHLYLECHGEGSPTVVLEAGYRASARYWTDDLAPRRRAAADGPARRG